MPAIITKGAFSAQGYGFGASAATGATYIEDVFSTYLYTGNGSTQTITNNIGLSTNGGMVWVKPRTATTGTLWDTVRGATKYFQPSASVAEGTLANGLTAFNNNGFSVGSYSGVNGNTTSISSWTFRNQPKFFDVVTFTGDGTNNRLISHLLNAVPGMVILKNLSAAVGAVVWHRSLSSTINWLILNGTAGAQDSSGGTPFSTNSTPMTSTKFVVSDFGNTSGSNYVAYLFAHNAGGFGAAGTDNVISCGSYTGNGSATGPAVTLGYEPQYVMVKCTSTTGGNWVVLDVMRGMSQTASNELFANLTSAETALNPSVIPTATGFTLGTTNADLNTNGATYIYMAIRRGPMKTPTDATKVFKPEIWSGNGTNSRVFDTFGFPIDAVWIGARQAASFKPVWVFDRLRGLARNSTASTAAEGTGGDYGVSDFGKMGGYVGGTADIDQFNAIGDTRVQYGFRRAPGFFDEVCYTGNGVAGRQITHNLGVVPELMIVKSRSSGTQDWDVYHSQIGNQKYIILNQTLQSISNSTIWNNTSPSASVFTVGNDTSVNQNGFTYVAYLFATLSGVSKVGSYTGTGAAQNIDCGFAASARFILIKRTDSTGDWYVYDSARGISASNDPYLLLNSVANEVTNTDYVGTYASGFALTSTAPAGLNANGGSFIFLAVA